MSSNYERTSRIESGFVGDRFFRSFREASSSRPRHCPPLSCEVLPGACGVLTGLHNRRSASQGMVSDAVERDARQLEQGLLASGALAGLKHEFIIREGDIWTELDGVIRQKNVDLVVVGTHGRGTLEKLLLGSVAEQIFRHADCPVLTVGPHSRQESPLENGREMRPFLFATDFSVHSVHALPHAVSFANHFKAKLCFLHVAP